MLVEFATVRAGAGEEWEAWVAAGGSCRWAAAGGTRSRRASGATRASAVAAIGRASGPGTGGTLIGIEGRR